MYLNSFYVVYQNHVVNYLTFKRVKMSIKKPPILKTLATVLSYQLKEYPLQENVLITQDGISVIDNNYNVILSVSTDIITSEIQDLTAYVNAYKLKQVFGVCYNPRLEFNLKNTYKSYPILEIKDGKGVFYFPYVELKTELLPVRNTENIPKMVSDKEGIYKKSDFQVFWDCELKSSSKNERFPMISISKNMEFVTNSYLIQFTKTNFSDVIGNCKIHLSQIKKLKPVFDNLFDNEITVKNCGDYVGFESNGIEVSIRKMECQELNIGSMFDDITSVFKGDNQTVEFTKKEIEKFFKMVKSTEYKFFVFGNNKVTLKDDYSYIFETPVKTTGLYNYFTKQACFDIYSVINSFKMPENIKFNVDRDNQKAFTTVDKNGLLIYGMCLSNPNERPKYN